MNVADQKKPIPGANDGASGVAVLLGMADALKKNAPAVGVDLLFVDGEDYGSFEDSTETLLGARYYAKNQAPGPNSVFKAALWKPASAVSAMLGKKAARAARTL